MVIVCARSAFKWYHCYTTLIKILVESNERINLFLHIETHKLFSKDTWQIIVYWLGKRWIIFVEINIEKNLNVMYSIIGIPEIFAHFWLPSIIFLRLNKENPINKKNKKYICWCNGISKSTVIDGNHFTYYFYTLTFSNDVLTMKCKFTFTIIINSFLIINYRFFFLH